MISEYCNFLPQKLPSRYCQAFTERSSTTFTIELKNGMALSKCKGHVNSWNFHSLIYVDGIFKQSLINRCLISSRLICYLSFILLKEGKSLPSQREANLFCSAMPDGGLYVLLCTCVRNLWSGIQDKRNFSNICSARQGTILSCLLEANLSCSALPKGGSIIKASRVGLIYSALYCPMRVRFCHLIGFA